MNLEERIEQWLKDNFDLSDMMVAMVLGLMFLLIGVIIHESAHKITALLLGCPAKITSLNFYFGLTNVSNTCPAKAMVLIALAGPMASFIYGLIGWFSGEDSVWRFMSNIIFAYSVLPNIWPAPYTDIAVAVNNGLNPTFAFFCITIPITAIIFYLWAREVVDRQKIFKY